MTEPELIKGCKNAERRSQEFLYKRFADRMFRVGFRYIRSDVDTEDVLITSFGKVFAAIGSFQYLGEGSLEAWVRKVVVNESLMWLRKRHNFNLTETLDENIPEPDLRQFSESGMEDIYKSIARLPTGYRAVFNLHAIDGYSHAEISTVLGISEGTSRSQLFKAKALLKKMLTQEGFNYGT